jgi:hypothetical protein
MAEAVDKDWVKELADQIGTRTRISYRVPAPPFGVIDPVCVVREAVTWLRDVRPFDGRRRSAWLHRDDLELSLRELGSELRAHVDPIVASFTSALELEKYAPAMKRDRTAAELEGVGFRNCVSSAGLVGHQLDLGRSCVARLIAGRP